MNRRDFCLATAGVLAGCGATETDDMAREFELQQSPTRTGHALHSDVAGYAFGRWTPSLGGDTTYTAQEGFYAKVGKFVFIQMRIVVNVLGTGSVSAISGLPFNSEKASPLMVCDTANLATAVVSIAGVTFDSPGATSIQIRSRVAASVADGANAVFGDGARLFLAGTYYAE